MTELNAAQLTVILENSPKFDRIENFLTEITHTHFFEFRQRCGYSMANEPIPDRATHPAAPANQTYPTVEEAQAMFSQIYTELKIRKRMQDMVYIETIMREIGLQPPQTSIEKT